MGKNPQDAGFQEMARAASSEVQDWYVAIIRGVAGYSPLLAAGSKSYKGFRESALGRGLEVVAEVFNVSGEVADRISGFDESGKQTGKVPLRELADSLNRDSSINAQEHLKKICV
ncbi:MAG: hypothetical protein KKB21_01580 [Nanoarchaeota archaeon]|nr:hypothetical protein [Nanoarchaeota archaeon]MBU4086247.1 hypothetical protein [Nanoarchaeota archaeon]